MKPDEGSVQFNIRISPELRERIRDFCHKNKIDKRHFAELMLEAGLLRKDLKKAEKRTVPSKRSQNGGV